MNKKNRTSLSKMPLENLLKSGLLYIYKNWLTY